MAKKPRAKLEPEKRSAFEYVKAVRDADGDLRFEYKLRGNVACCMGHDENVSGWSDRDIVKLACALLECEPKDVSVENE
ncbi:MAG: hypothetical protein ACHP7J_00170 [Terriglobales bacterium]